MHVLVPICCFCGKVLNDEEREFGQEIWVAVETYRARHDLIAEEVWLAPTYCPDCATSRAFDRGQSVS
jgi:hypothetical protein